MGWFGTELGAQSTYTNKEGEGERSIVNGAHDTATFTTLLDKFIEKYVCCENCHLPEIDMAIKKGNITGRCKACGWMGDLDNGHKLAAFITKNPPTEDGLNIVAPGGETGGKKSKEERRKAKLQKRDQQANDDEDEDEDDDSVKEKKEKKEKKDKKEKKENKKEKKHKEEDDDDDDDEEGVK